ncbi:hypothetical protein H9C73_14305 [Marinobacterium sp. AK62]|uniref:Uncharacterized protein n=1 Tax=Marinobacterium alkalitolerans TaxID=1542925 RepID=A0ABS3ZDY0_9GAMM|nr:hypothetical protein [Marinobacterium alkalitolerans]MBP0049902.1 hypothetical protein [Marinobacterium alkalitolerans]
MLSITDTHAQMTPTTAAKQPEATGGQHFSEQLKAAIAEQAQASADEAKAQFESQPPMTAEEPVQDARETLLEILQMTPAERIRYTLLKEMGLTEESLSKLPPEERERIEALIEKEIERQLGGGDNTAEKATQAWQL